MSGIWLLGGGGHAKVVLATLEAMIEPVAGIYDDDPALQGRTLLNISIAGKTPEPDWWSAEPRRAFVAIGNNVTREKVARLKADWVIARHPMAEVHESVRIGPGSLICAGVVIQPDTRIGEHVIANTSSSIDHDCELADFVHIAPGVHLAGGVRVGKRSFIGIGASVVPGVTIGDDATIGAGSVVLNDVPSGATYVGVPAKPIIKGQGK